jgi:hypothetical protein
MRPPNADGDPRIEPNIDASIPFAKRWRDRMCSGRDDSVKQIGAAGDRKTDDKPGCCSTLRNVEVKQWPEDGPDSDKEGRKYSNQHWIQLAPR